MDRWKAFFRAAVVSAILSLGLVGVALYQPPAPDVAQPAPAAMQPPVAAAPVEVAAPAAPTGPPAEAEFGWAGQDLADAARTALGDRQAFASLPGEYEAVRERRIGLWSIMRHQLDGKQLECWRQQTGDCVSHGFGHACDYALATEIVVKGREARFVRAFRPFLYGTGRVQVGGGRLRGAGSTGAWQSKAIETYGVLPMDVDGCPTYSGSLANKWGLPPGPPQQFRDIARDFKGECRLVTTFEDAVVALSNGWPVAVCSGTGFNRIVEAHGRIEGRVSGSWPHCMCFIGFDTRAGQEALYCQNSWGPNAHAPAGRYDELDGAPPGGFWVAKDVAERMLSGRDSYSVSFGGYERRNTVEVLKAAANGQQN